MEGASPLPNQPPQPEGFYRPTNLPSQEGFEPLLKFLANRWQGT